MTKATDRDPMLDTHVAAALAELDTEVRRT
jgi:hypothetical protein